MKTFVKKLKITKTTVFLFKREKQHSITNNTIDPTISTVTTMYSHATVCAK